MTDLEELQSLLGQPSSGSQDSEQEKRIQSLHEQVVTRLAAAVMDTYSHKDLAEMYLDEAFGDELARPRIVLSDEFKEMWKDLLLDEEDGDVLVNEAKDARKHGDNFQPNTALYGRAIFIYDANNDSADNSHIVGSLKRITGPHTYIIEVDGENQEWEVDSVGDLEVPDVDGEPLYLWNAWR